MLQLSATFFSFNQPSNTWSAYFTDLKGDVGITQAPAEFEFINEKTGQHDVFKLVREWSDVDGDLVCWVYNNDTTNARVRIIND